MIDVLKNGNVLLSFDNKTFDSKITTKFDALGMASLVLYPGKKIYQINIMVNEMQNDWLRIRELKYKFDFQSHFTITLFKRSFQITNNVTNGMTITVNRTVTTNETMLSGDSKLILDDSLETGYKIDNRQNIISLGFKTKINMEDCSICMRTRGLKYKDKTNQVVFGLDEYGKFEGIQNEIHESDNFYCFSKEIKNDFSINIIENKDNVAFDIIGLFFEGECMYNF